MPEAATIGAPPEREAPSTGPAWFDRRQRRTFVAMATQVALIGLGVFLGLAGEQWRQARQDHANAIEALRRFRAEVVANRTELSTKLAYHTPLQKDVRAFLTADSEQRKAMSLEFSGLQPPFFERTAWDLAIATQSLAHLDQDVAFGLSRIYTMQGLLMELGRGMTQAMYLNPPREDYVAFLGIVDLYYSDLVGIEPMLLEQYEEILPQIDGAMSN